MFYMHVKFGGGCGGRRKSWEFLSVCLSVCLSRLWVVYKHRSEARSLSLRAILTPFTGRF